ncbi:MAG: oligosaccharide flippase family protein [Desulfovibrio sp.]|uniref:lipopolysaccharide biosynthesis protein n=1 Tax=Desulfovibrio sp. TaxID=885 RepID=UPI001A69237A|nr:oligosaccharide flippase family protein [Desulfovibrio sp.]MBD5416908.1 oligosaccharide flippase family protein [Desulfovibrio sp.]
MRRDNGPGPLSLFRPLFGVFFSLGAIKATQIVLPLLAIPWLARILDMRTFGILMYFSILPSMVETLMNWGFTLGAVRDVAFARGGRHRQAAILGAVTSAKFLLAGFCLLGALLLVPVIPYAREYPGVYLLAILYGVARGFRPLWFYRGVRQGMRRVTIWETLANLTILALIVLLIDRPERWGLYFAFNFLCRALVSAYLLRDLSKSWPFRLNLKRAWRILRKTRTLFANNLTNMVHAETAKLVLGYFLLPAEMGIYLAADKIIKAVSDASEPLTQTIYPEICALRHGNAKTAGRMLFWSLIVTVGLLLLAALLLWFTAPWLIPLALGAKYAEAIPILNIMVAALPIMGMNGVIGPQVLVASGHERPYFFSSVFVAAASLPLAMLLPTLFGLKGAACLNIVLSLLFFAALAICIRKYCPGFLSPTPNPES